MSHDSFAALVPFKPTSVHPTENTHWRTQRFQNQSNIRHTAGYRVTSRTSFCHRPAGGESNRVASNADRRSFRRLEYIKSAYPISVGVMYIREHPRFLVPSSSI